MVVATFMKYTLHVIDFSLEHPWENRNVYLLYGELITGNFIVNNGTTIKKHPFVNFFFKNVKIGLITHLFIITFTGFVKCCLYFVFVIVMVKIHTFPLFAIRPMYLTIRGFKKSLSDVILSRRAIAYMNTR